MFTVINYGYTGEQLRGYIKWKGRGLWYWQLIGNTVMKCGQSADFDRAKLACDAAAKALS